MPFDAILFDFDGVLVDSEPIHCDCWAQVLAPFGITLNWGEYRDRYLGMDDREMIRRLAAEADPPLAWDALWAQYPRKKELFQRRMEQPPFPGGLLPLLEGLQRKFKLAVVSSSARSEIEPPLIAGGLRHYFSALVTGGDAPRHKPAPDPYLLAARLVDARVPLVVEDSPAGIASGHAAGFEVLAVGNAAEMPRILLDRLSGGLPA
ncbi:MAG: HAD family hydrolase [Terriglobia bacterium]|nr:MAG: HAD family hydrolase [Terriglobia bacterium]